MAIIDTMDNSTLVQLLMFCPIVVVAGCVFVSDLIHYIFDRFVYKKKDISRDMDRDTFYY